MNRPRKNRVTDRTEGPRPDPQSVSEEGSRATALSEGLTGQSGIGGIKP